MLPSVGGQCCVSESRPLPRGQSWAEPAAAQLVPRTLSTNAEGPQGGRQESGTTGRWHRHAGSAPARLRGKQGFRCGLKHPGVQDTSAVLSRLLGMSARRPPKSRSRIVCLRVGCLERFLLRSMASQGCWFGEKTVAEHAVIWWTLTSDPEHRSWYQRLPSSPR